MPKVENDEQAKAVALYEFRKIYPYGVKVRMNVSRMADIWIVRLSFGNPAKEMEYRINADTAQAWKIK